MTDLAGLRGTGCLVLGAASARGSAIARRLAAGGAILVLADRDVVLAGALARELDGVAMFVERTNPAHVAGALRLTAERAPMGAVVDCVVPPAVTALTGPDGPVALSAFQRGADAMVVGTANVLRLTAQALACDAGRPRVYAGLADGDQGGWARACWEVMVRGYADELAQLGVAMATDERGLMAALRHPEAEPCAP